MIESGAVKRAPAARAPAREHVVVLFHLLETIREQVGAGPLGWRGPWRDGNSFWGRFTQRCAALVAAATRAS